MALSVTKKRLFQKNTHTASAIAGGSHTNAVGIAAPDAPSLAPVPREVPRDAYAAASFNKRRGGSLRRARIDGSRANPSSDFVLYKTDGRMCAVWLSTTRVCATFVTSRRMLMRGMCDANTTPATGTAWCQLSRVHAKCVTAPHVHVWDLQATQMPHARTREARTCRRRVGAAARQRARHSGVRL